jgi:hypothetical protein
MHVEFVASRDIYCKVDFSMRACGGVRYMSDTIQGGDHGADAIKFERVGDYQYLVYVSIFKHRASPKAANTTEAALSESQSQLKLFAPKIGWPVQVFEIPSVPANSGLNYWSVFCLNGRDGLRGISPINQLTSGAPDNSICSQRFGKRKRC